MAGRGSHVPNNSVSHNIYTDQEFNSLYRGNPDQSLNQQPAWNLADHLSVPNANPTSLPQAWHPQQPHAQPGGLDQFYGVNTYAQNQSPLNATQFVPQRSASQYVRSPAVDSPSVQHQNVIRQQGYELPSRSPAGGQAATITPQALHNAASNFSSVPKSASGFQDGVKAVNQIAFQPQGLSFAGSSPVVMNKTVVVPKGKKNGKFVIVEFDVLAKATNSSRLHNYATISEDAIELPINKTTVPQYTPRKSSKEIKAISRADKKIRLVKKSGSTKTTKTASPSKSLSTVKPGAGRSPSAVISESDSETDSSDDDSDSDDDLEIVPEVSPLPKVKPGDPKGGVNYDVIQATWHPRRSQPSEEKIRQSLAAFWEVTKTIQYRWRADSKAVADAEEKKQTSELPLLRSRVQDQRDLLETALKTALEYAHPTVVHHFGQIASFLYMLYQFLANRFKQKDFDGSLPTAIYEILSQCRGTLSKDNLEKTKLSKALSLLVNKVNEKNKTNIQRVLDIGSPDKPGSPDADKPAQAKVKVPQTEKSGDRQLSVSSKAIKPPVTNAVASKKIATGSAAAKPGAAPKMTTSIVTQKRPGTGKPAITANSAAKPKPNQVVPKPNSFFSTLASANKKTIAAKAAAAANANAAKTTEKRPVPTAPVAPVKPAFSFNETMASLLKPKEPEVVAKPEKQLPPETAEEKARRLRKESRRHLRVAFRPDATLVQIKYFEHEPEEDMGHEMNLLRDAGDVSGEGRMFKAHKDMEDEEDDDMPLEQSYRNWTEPTNIDFDVVDLDQRKRNYDGYGGGLLKPKCPEKAANEIREATTLMVFYTTPEDIPASPREPFDQPSLQEPIDAPEFGAPPPHVLARAAAFTASGTSNPQQPSGPATDYSDLEAIFKKYATKNAGAAQPVTPYPAYPQYTAASAYPTAYSAAPSVAGPVSSHAAPSSAPGLTPELSSLLKSLQASSQPAAPPPPQPALDVNAILAALQQNSAPASTSTATFPTMPAVPSLPSWPYNQAYQQPAYAQQQPQQSSYAPQQPQYQPGPYENEDRKRFREADGNDRDSGGSYKKQKGGGRNGGKPHKVFPCRYYKQGLCTKGDACTYIHDGDDQR